MWGLAWYKATFDLRAEIARGSLGMLWLILEPLLYLGSLSVVFIAIKQQSDDGFIQFLFVGLVIWKWFAMSISQGANAIVGHTGLMRQVYIPKMFFPLVSLMINFFKFAIVFCLLLVVLFFSGIEISIVWSVLPVLLLVQFLLLMSLVFFLSWLICYIPDVKMIVDNSLMFLFFLSGVLFDVSKAPESIQAYLKLNPMLHMINAFRSVFLKNEWPDWQALLIVTVCSSILFLLAAWLLHKHDRKIPKVVLR
ncbi:MAG: ABC transporter permease [Piscirickettsiaceae bacterium]|nr:ABC transporter permease [Piscirickettsiaceae bacterium]